VREGKEGKHKGYVSKYLVIFTYILYTSKDASQNTPTIMVKNPEEFAKSPKAASAGLRTCVSWLSRSCVFYVCILYYISILDVKNKDGKKRRWNFHQERRTILDTKENKKSKA
jgi:hypothetical protein